MMRSPIPDAFWINMFRGTVVTIGGLSLLSMYNEYRKSTGTVNAPLARMRGKNLEMDDVVDALNDLNDVLDEEQRAKTSGAKLAMRKSGNAGTLVKLLKFDPDNADESAAMVMKVLKLVARIYAEEPEGRDAFHAAGGYKKLLALVANAHSEHHPALMDASSKALCDLTTINDGDIVLPLDVPAGSAGTVALGKFGSTVRMLRTLDKNARQGFLVNVTGTFANLCMLRSGAQTICRGIDDRSGLDHFLALLDPKGNQLVAEHCARAVHWLAIHAKPETHPELCENANVTKLVDCLDPFHSAPTLKAVIGAISAVVYNAHAAEFLTEFFAANGVTALIKVWCKASDKYIRERAELAVRVIARREDCASEVGRLLEMHRSMLMERRAKDEEAQRKAQQQAQQQRMYQQQMMMQMAEQGGMPPGMMEEMMGE